MSENIRSMFGLKAPWKKKPIFDPPVALKLIAGDPLVQEELTFVLTGWGMHGGTIGKPLIFELNVKNGQGKPTDIDSQRLTTQLSQDLKNLAATLKEFPKENII